VIDDLFRELRLNRIEIQCAARNARSAAIPRRLGFTLEGIRREAELVNGEFRDLLHFSLLRKNGIEWNARALRKCGNRLCSNQPRIVRVLRFTQKWDILPSSKTASSVAA